MSNILKSVKLDVAVIKPYFKTLCFRLLLPIAFVAINRSLLTGISFVMSYIAMTTGYTFTITEKNSMDRLYGILPVRKSELVIGRYIFVLIIGVLSMFISLIAQMLILNAMGEVVGMFDIITAAVTGMFLYTLYTVFQIPGYYKFGYIKGRVFMYIPAVGLLVTMLFLTKTSLTETLNLSTLDCPPVLLAMITFLLVIVMYAVSILFSIRIMKNKEI